MGKDGSKEISQEATAVTQVERSGWSVRAREVVRSVMEWDQIQTSKTVF